MTTAPMPQSSQVAAQISFKPNYLYHKGGPIPYSYTASKCWTLFSIEITRHLHIPDGLGGNSRLEVGADLLANTGISGISGASKSLNKSQFRLLVLSFKSSQCSTDGHVIPNLMADFPSHKTAHHKYLMVTTVFCDLNVGMEYSRHLRSDSW